jgi:hypothetical protein
MTAGPDPYIARAAFAQTPITDEAAVMCSQLRDLGDGLKAQLAELERDFTDDRADAVIRNLAGAATFVRRLAIAREVQP